MPPAFKVIFAGPVVAVMLAPMVSAPLAIKSINPVPEVLMVPEVVMAPVLLIVTVPFPV